VLGRPAVKGLLLHLLSVPVIDHAFFDRRRAVLRKSAYDFEGPLHLISGDQNPALNKL